MSCRVSEGGVRVGGIDFCGIYGVLPFRRGKGAASRPRADTPTSRHRSVAHPRCPMRGIRRGGKPSWPRLPFAGCPNGPKDVPDRLGCDAPTGGFRMAGDGKAV